MPRWAEVVVLTFGGGAVSFLVLVALAKLCARNDRLAAEQGRLSLVQRALQPTIPQRVRDWDDRMARELRERHYEATAPENFRGGPTAGAEVIPLRRRENDRGWAA